MRFLALETWQALLLGSVTAGVVVALFFLKLRHRRVLVASALLWNRVLDDAQAHSLIEKLRRLISLLVAVTIGLLLALALGRPEIEALSGRSRRIAVVMDSSPSMAARTSDGRTRWDHALALARQTLQSAGPADQFMVIDTSGRIATSLTADRNEAIDSLRKLSIRAGTPHLPSIDLTDTDLYFVSDGVALRDLPAHAKRLSVFEPADNVGITAFEIRSTPLNPLGYEAYLEVENYSKAAKDVRIVIIGAGRQQISRSVKLEPRAPYRQTFNMENFSGGGVRASVQSADDALDIDDSAFSYLPARRKARTVLVTNGNNYLETLLRLDPQVGLTVVAPAQFKESPTVDVYVFDRFAPATRPSKPSLLFRPPNVAWLPQSIGTVTKPEIAAWNAEHPVMQFVPVHDLNIQQASRIDPRGAIVVASALQTPVIVTADQPVKTVLVGFALGESDFPLHLGFPIFVANTLTWFGGDQLAIRRPPGLVEVPLRHAEIATIDGQRVDSKSHLGSTVFEALQPGLFTARTEGVRQHVAVSLTSRMFSDINATMFDANAPGNGVPRPILSRELWFYMLALALVLVAAEWWTYHRRITV